MVLMLVRMNALDGLNLVSVLAVHLKPQSNAFIGIMAIIFGLLIWLLPKEAGTYRFPTGRPFLGILLIVLGILLFYFERLAAG